MKTIKKLFTASTLVLMLASAAPAFAQSTDNGSTTTTTRTTEDNEDHGKWGLAGLLGLLGLLGLKKKDNDVHVHRTTTNNPNTGMR